MSHCCVSWGDYTVSGINHQRCNFIYYAYALNHLLGRPQASTVLYGDFQRDLKNNNIILPEGWGNEGVLVSKSQALHGLIYV